MADILVLIAVAVLLVLAFKGAVKHFRGERSCCGSSGGEGLAQEKALSGPVMGRKTLTISGMHCDHCVKAVTDALNGIDGVSARVDLKSGTAKVIYDSPVEESQLKEAVEKAGFEVLSLN